MSLFDLPSRKREDKEKKAHHHAMDTGQSQPGDRGQSGHEAVPYTTEPAYDNGQQKVYREYNEGGYPNQPAHENRRHTDKLTHENVQPLDQQQPYRHVRYTVAEPAYEEVQEKTYTGTRIALALLAGGIGLLRALQQYRQENGEERVVWSRQGGDQNRMWWGGGQRQKQNRSWWNWQERPQNRPWWGGGQRQEQNGSWWNRQEKSENRPWWGSGDRRQEQNRSWWGGDRRQEQSKRAWWKREQKRQQSGGLPDSVLAAMSRTQGILQGGMGTTQNVLQGGMGAARLLYNGMGVAQDVFSNGMGNAQDVLYNGMGSAQDIMARNARQAQKSLKKAQKHFRGMQGNVQRNVAMNLARTQGALGNGSRHVGRHMQNMAIGAQSMTGNVQNRYARHVRRRQRARQLFNWGVAFGTVMALLYAPIPGSEFRRNIAMRWQQYSTYLGF